MNESTLVELKICVERAVRPVRASTSRKRKMREELLAHLTAVFEQESKAGDESAALERTARRFGAAADLTRQLQAATPARDRPAWLIEAVIGFPPRESMLRLAMRLAVVTGVLASAGLVVMVSALGIWSELLTVARLPTLLAPVYMAVLTFGAALCGQSLSRALSDPRGRSWPRLLGIGVAAWALVPGVSFLWCFAISGNFVASAVEISPLLVTGLLAPLAMVIAVRALQPELQREEEWASLPIAGEKGAIA